MIKIDRITIRLSGGASVLNHHQSVRLARAIGESLAAQSRDPQPPHRTTIDRIGVVHRTDRPLASGGLAGDISHSILSRIRKG